MMLIERLQAVCLRLREQGSRVTPQRLAIIEHVFESREHPTVQAIFAALAQRYPTMSLATVYKTVHLLEELGEVALVTAEAGRARYDGTTCLPHVHLICQGCGAIADAPGAATAGLLEPVRGSGWQVSGWRLEVMGACPVCIAAGNGSPDEDATTAANRN